MTPAQARRIVQDIAGLVALAALIALIAMVLTWSALASSEPTTLRLACKGSTSSWLQGQREPQPFSGGILVDFAKQTVKGFPFGIGGTLEFNITETSIQVYQSNGITSVVASIDRITGEVKGTVASYKSMKVEDLLKPENSLGGFDFALKCTPTQWMF